MILNDLGFESNYTKRNSTSSTVRRNSILINSDSCIQELELFANKDVSISIPLNITGVVTQISNGQKHSVILTDSRRVFAFGNNENGQINVPKKAQGETIKVDCGYLHTQLLNIDGEVITFGDNTFKQCD